MDASRANAPIVIGVCAGEASGDALGAELIAAVKLMHPELRFVGIGGPRMQSAGCTVWYPMSRLALRGYVEVLSHLPGLVRLRREFYSGCVQNVSRCSSASMHPTSPWGSKRSSSARVCGRSTM